MSGGTPEGGVVGGTGAKIDGRAKITGQARFVADMKLPRMVHGAFLRSPHAHARILSLGGKVVREA
jgi:CO/xanthine dehydrogenase Mo-binding subunit